MNSLAPVAAVRTPGSEALGLLPDDPTLVEPLEVTVEAALAMCTGKPGAINGRVVRTRDILEELGRTPRTLDGSADYTE